MTSNKINSKYKFIFLLLTFFITSFIFIKNFHTFNENVPSRHGDDGVYFNTAFNIDKYNVSSSQIKEYRVFNHKNAIKPPMYSFFLSLFMDTEKKYKDVTLECIYDNNIKTNCLRFVQKTKLVNLITHFIHALTLLTLIYVLTKNIYLSFIGGILFITSTYFLNKTNIFFTENFSGLILLIHSTFLYLMYFGKKNRNFYTIISSITLGLLILTKAIFLYWFYILIILQILFFGSRKMMTSKCLNPPFALYLINFKQLIIFAVVVLILVIPWQIRNFIDKGNFTISLQSGNAISERVEYLKTDNKDIKLGIIYYLPFDFIKKQFKDDLKDKSYMFDEGHPNSHYINSDSLEKGYVLSKLKWKDKDDPEKIFDKSIELIFQDPIKHAYLSLMFFIRGIFLDTFDSNLPTIFKIISSLVHWSSVIFLPIIMAYLLIKKKSEILVILPSIFIIFAYTAFTDFEPRYGSIITSIYILIILILFNKIFKKNESNRR